MDQANIVIQSVKPLKCPKLEIEATDGKRYVSDLGEYQNIKCFPKDQVEWETVGITAHGFNLTWSSRFELNIDQVIDTAISSENILLQA